MTPFVSIIIPVKALNAYIRESLPVIRSLDYDGFEVIVLPDFDGGEALPGAMIVPTGPAGPAEKRDMALAHARGELLAFLDDDAYPRRDWLRKAVRHFERAEVAAVGGPAVTPESDSVRQRASGRVFSSWLASGRYGYRYEPGRLMEVDDFPTVNLIVRREAFVSAGGFDTTYWPGEDTKLCLDLTKRLGKKIIYDPEALVYHHRRPLFGEHLRQVGRYGFYRGRFARVLPETSMRPMYFVPSFFSLGLFAGGAASMAEGTIAALYLLALSLYAALLVAASVSITVKERDLAVGALAVPGIFLTHLVYGLSFIRGLASARREG